MAEHCLIANPEDRFSRDEADQVHMKLLVNSPHSNGVLLPPVGDCMLNSNKLDLIKIERQELENLFMKLGSLCNSVLTGYCI